MTYKKKRPLLFRIIFGLFKFTFKTIRFTLKTTLMLVGAFLQAGTDRKKRPDPTDGHFAKVYKKEREYIQTFGHVLTDLNGKRLYDE